MDIAVGLATRSTMLSTTKLRRLLYLFVIYLLTIDSDAALVSSTFEITHSSNFESRWLLSSDHFENSDFSPAARIDPAPKNDLPYQKYDTQTTQRILLEEYSFCTSVRDNSELQNSYLTFCRSSLLGLS